MRRRCVTIIKSVASRAHCAIGAKMSKISFTDHPASVGETYLEHMGQATFFGTRMVAAGVACLLHGLLPFLFTTTGSRTIALLHERMVANRRRKSLPQSASADDFAYGTGI